MTDKKPNDLIARLEAAETGSRELDGEIDVKYMNADGEQWPARYTTSLDAALTLVPEEWGWLVEVWQREESWAQVVCRPKGSTTPSGIFEGAEAKSPALAVCIAVLKAIQK